MFVISCHASSLGAVTCFPCCWEGADRTIRCAHATQDLLDKYLIPSASTTEAAVFYLKMKADYHRYLSEYKVDEAKTAAAELTLAAYKVAQEKADELPTTNPIRCACCGRVGHTSGRERVN